MYPVANTVARAYIHIVNFLTIEIKETAVYRRLIMININYSLDYQVQFGKLK